MGFLPIIVAIVGFLFLWGVVNYHSLKNRKKEVAEAAELVYRYAALRQNIVIQLSNIENSDESMISLLNQVKKFCYPIDKNMTTAAEIIADGQKLSQQLDELPDQIGKNKIYRSSLEQLQKADFAYRVAANRYSLKAKQYLQLVTKPPSKFIAGLFGFSSHDNQPSAEVTAS